MRCRIVVIGGLLIASAGWTQGYRLERDRVSVTSDQLQAWKFPQGSLSFGSEGVRPHLVRSKLNAALDAGTFVRSDGSAGGVRNAGTSAAQAAQIIDGQEDTFWEPDLTAPLKDWWVEIDLGRAVWAKKIVVKFAGEGEGDPFLQFRVLTSNGQPAFSQSKALNYLVVGRSEGLNQTQRVFEFDLEPTVETEPGLTGDVIQFVQIVATASSLGQAEEISPARWDSLSAADRGEVLYFRREASGYERQVDQAEYQGLADPARRGAVKYYRRERPRLAEVEVWTVGDNISLGALGRGGKIQGYGGLGAEVLTVDGDYNTLWSAQVGLPTNGADPATIVVQDPERNLFFDLATWYWVDRVLVVYSRSSYTRFFMPFPSYAVTLSDGTVAPDGSLVYTHLSGRRLGDQQGVVGSNVFVEDNRFALTKARYLRLDYRVIVAATWLNSDLCELQLYGSGFLPQVSLASPLIELGRNPRILSQIDWDADLPPGTRVQVRTRTGNQVEQEVRYFTKTGVEVGQAEYRKLLSFQRGDTLVATIPGSDWSNWSQFYPQPGAAITSPSPRRYALIRVELLSDDPDQGVTLRGLDLHLKEPLASQVLGEITPQQIERSGEPETFTLFLKPDFQANSLGFDQVLVELPPSAEAEVVEVALGQEDELVAGRGRVYRQNEIEVVRSGADSLWIQIPEKVQAQELLALRFSGRLYLASNAFAASVGLGGEGERVWQRVDAGEATPLVKGIGMMVQTPFEGRLLGAVEVSPNPFTPNGDGINDTVELVFPVFKVLGSKSLVLEVYGLDGTLVQRQEKAVAHAAGLQRLSWDGRDREGRLLPPGMYICRVGLRVDDERGDQPLTAKIIASVY